MGGWMDVRWRLERSDSKKVKGKKRDKESKEIQDRGRAKKETKKQQPGVDGRTPTRGEREESRDGGCC